MNIVFTKHAKERMERRGISEDEVINVIKFPEKTRKVDNIYYVRKKLASGTIEIVFEKENYIKVITLYSI